MWKVHPWVASDRHMPSCWKRRACYWERSQFIFITYGCEKKHEEGMTYHKLKHEADHHLFNKSQLVCQQKKKKREFKEILHEWRHSLRNKWEHQDNGNSSRARTQVWFNRQNHCDPQLRLQLVLKKQLRWTWGTQMESKTWQVWANLAGKPRRATVQVWDITLPKQGDSCEATKY